MTKGFKFTHWINPVNQSSTTDWIKIPIDNGTTNVTVGYIFRGDEDKCLDYFGEQDEECKKNNQT